MYFHTHDAALAGRLRGLWRTALQSRKDVHPRLPALTEAEATVHHTPTVVIAHPHGRMKHVTVGELQGTESGVYSHRPKVLYSAGTCPGSSGGLVLPLWRRRREDGYIWEWMPRYPHSVGWSNGRGRSADWGWF